MSGGELFDRIVSQREGHYSEKEAARIMREIVSAVAYMHSRNVMHRDLKVIFCSRFVDGNSQRIF